MTDAAAASLSPRQRECLRLVWTRQATSKEIAAELGISKSTVDSYIAEAVELLGARDRRDAAAQAFGSARREFLHETPRAVSGGDPARVAPGATEQANERPSVGRATMPVPWRTREHPRNSLLLGQTLGWIFMITLGSLAALALATSIGSGLPPVARSVIDAAHRLER